MKSIVDDRTTTINPPAIMSHTPGPWVIREKRGHPSNYNVRLPVGPVEAIAPSVADVWALGINRPLAEQEANARLIASAPDAHAILSELRDWFAASNSPTASSLIDEDETWADVLNAYFAKVEGRS